MNNRPTPTLLFLGLALFASAVALAGDTPACAVCKMKVDAKHNVQFRYALESGKTVSIGSLTCAKSYWSSHKAEKLGFEATDFVTGAWSKADDGRFLVGSKLNVGTGMDKASVVFFAKAATAEKARAANGGVVVRLPDALKRAAGDAHGGHRH